MPPPLAEPTDEDVKLVFDDALDTTDGAFASSEDDDDDELADDASDERDDGADDDEADDPSDDDDGTEDDDDTEDGEDDEPEETSAERRAREAEERLAQVEADRERERREAAAVAQGQQLLDRFLAKKAELDAADERAVALGKDVQVGDSWTRFQADLNEGWKNKIIELQAAALRQVADREQGAKVAAEEDDAFEYFYAEMNAKIPGGFSRTEEAFMRTSLTPLDAQENLTIVLEDRRSRTAHLRKRNGQETRAKRKATGADRTGVRGNGGASQRKANRDEYAGMNTSEEMSAVLDEAFA